MIENIIQGSILGTFGLISGMLINDMLYINQYSRVYWVIPTITTTLGIVRGYTNTDVVSKYQLIRDELSPK